MGRFPEPEPSSTLKLVLHGAISDFSQSKLERLKMAVAQQAGCRASQVTLRLTAGSIIVHASLPSSAAGRLKDSLDEQSSVLHSPAMLGGLQVAKVSCSDGCQHMHSSARSAAGSLSTGMAVVVLVATASATMALMGILSFL